MKGEIITVGDELTSGRIADHNARFIARRLNDAGFGVVAISTVGDDPDMILGALNQAAGRADFVIVSGGLGSTEDDVTCQAAAEFCGRPLEINQPLFDRLRYHLERRGINRIADFEKMAYLPRGAELIDPKIRSCGFVINQSDKPVFFLPGVPAELETLIDDLVVPRLIGNRTGDRVIVDKVLRVFGLDEPTVGARVAGVIEAVPGLSVGYYPCFPEVEVTLTVRGPDREQAAVVIGRAEEQLRRELGDHVYGSDNDSLESVVGDLLRQRGMTIAVAESCTGGLIGHRLTAVAGSSDYVDRVLVTYSNRAKVELLGVDQGTLDEHGAVSAETATQMARGVRERSGVDLGLATTGIAGPGGGSPEKPVGTVYIALTDGKRLKVRRRNLSGNRRQIKALTAATALNWVRRSLIDGSFYS